MTNEQQIDYKSLIAYGHSPAKALEIILDVMRGDDFATFHTRFVRKIVSAIATA